MREGMHVGRLIWAGYHNTCAAVSLKITRDGRHFLEFAGRFGAFSESHTQRPSKLFDFGGAENNAVIGHAAGGRWRRFHHIHPVERGLIRRLTLRLHLRRQNNWAARFRRVGGGLIGARCGGSFLITFLPVLFGLRVVRDVGHHAALFGELAGVYQVSGTTRKEIRIERDDYVRLIEAVVGVRRTSEGQRGSKIGVVAPTGFILMPFGSRQVLEKSFDLRCESWRSHGFGEDPQAVAVFDGSCLARATERGLRRYPTADAAVVGDGLRAVGIVHGQDGRQVEIIRSAAAARMVGIAFDLGGTAEVASDQKSGSDSAHLHGGCVIERHTRNKFLRLAHIGDDSFGWLLGASCDARQG